MQNWSSRHTLRKIIDWSLTAKIGGSIIGLFWFLQWIRDEWLPQKWEERLRLINLIPHWHWYIWAILLLTVFLFGAFEGAVRWNRNEVAPLLGWPGTLQNGAFVLARRMRDFIQEFAKNNGGIPEIRPTNDENERIRMNAEATAWGMKFSQQFRVSLLEEAEKMVEKIRAQGVAIDLTAETILHQSVLFPNAVMLSAAYLMAGALSLSLTKPN